MTTNLDDRVNNFIPLSSTSTDAMLFSQYDQAAIVSFRNSGLTSTNLTELLDINELFQDDFFPHDVDYSSFLAQMEDVPISEDMFSAQSSVKNDSYRPFEETALVKNDVILIPPKMPFVPSIKDEANNDESFDDIYTSSKVARKSNSIDVKSEWKSTKAVKFVEDGFGDDWKVERRERNREHAKRSRIRKRLLLDSLQDQLQLLRDENVKLRRVIAEKIPHLSSKILSECTTTESSLLADTDSASESSDRADLHLSTTTTSTDAKSALHQNAKILMESDFRLIQSLITSQQNFVISDPLLPDNPIVYSSDGFCKMTGYKMEDVLGRNCRFLQGPGTDQAAVNVIRQGIIEGKDISVCLLNYKADGTPFWNQFFLAALKDDNGLIVNYVGVQCEVNHISVLQMKDRVKKIPMLMNDE